MGNKICNRKSIHRQSSDNFILWRRFLPASYALNSMTPKKNACLLTTNLKRAVSLWIWAEVTLFFQLALRCLQNYYNSLLPWHPYNPVVCCLNLKRSKVEECLKLKLPKLDEDDFKLNLLPMVVNLDFQIRKIHSPIQFWNLPPFLHMLPIPVLGRYIT